jgi:hypothetical protein
LFVVVVVVLLLLLLGFGPFLFSTPDRIMREYHGTIVVVVVVVVKKKICALVCLV